MGFAKYVLIWMVLVGSWFNLNVAYPLIQDFGLDVLPPDTLPLSVPELTYDYELIPVQPPENKDSSSFLLPPTQHRIEEPESLPPDVELVPSSIMMKGDGKPVIAGNGDGSSGILPPDVEIIPGSYIPMTYYFHNNRRPDGMIPPYFPGRKPPVWTISPNVELIPSNPSHPLRPVVPAPAKPSWSSPFGSFRRSASEVIDIEKGCNCSLPDEPDTCLCSWEFLNKLLSSMRETERGGSEHSFREPRSSHDDNVNSSLPQRHERRVSVDTNHEAKDITPESTEQTENHKTEHVSSLRKSASLSYHPDKSKRKSLRLVDRPKSKLVRDRSQKNVKPRSLREVYSEDGLPELSLSPAERLRTDNSSSDNTEISTESVDYKGQESDSSTLSWDFEEEIEGDPESYDSGNTQSVQPKTTENEHEDFPTATSIDNGKVFSDEIEDADLIDSTLVELDRRLDEIEDADFDDDVTEESDDGEEDMKNTKALSDHLEIVYETTTMLSNGNPEHRMKASLSEEETGKDIYDLYDSDK